MEEETKTETTEEVKPVCPNCENSGKFCVECSDRTVE